MSKYDRGIIRQLELIGQIYKGIADEQELNEFVNKNIDLFSFKTLEIVRENERIFKDNRCVVIITFKLFTFDVKVRVTISEDGILSKRSIVDVKVHGVDSFIYYVDFEFTDWMNNLVYNAYDLYKKNILEGVKQNE